MRSLLLRFSAMLAATGLATMSVLAVAATPAAADDGFEIWMKGFDEYPGSDSVDWPVSIVNNTDNDLKNPTLRLSLFEEEDDLSALVLSTDDTACEKTDTDAGMDFTCVFPNLAANSETTIDFTMKLREGADRVNHGLSYATAQLRQPDAEDNPTYAEKMVTLDASLPLDDEGRITDLKAPKQVSSDQVIGGDGKGEELSFTVVNNDYDMGTLVHANLVVAVDRKTGIVPATELDGCEYSKGRTVLTCPMEGLGAKDKRDYAFTLWARDADAWQNAKPGKVNIDIVIPHGDHEDTWAHADAKTKLVKGNGNGSLPVTGSSLTTPIAVGVAAVVLGVVALLVTRRRKTTGGVTSE
ncbi:LPXTG cell wall anchor domain-containing protein [Stackebrandtia nassauensis]|uniref:LPXTG-motif cell wall anchor domain protein n=1 Tax=Stackebrandtia nassauensis (strain DSM 44728 / CIP 108903 / NRRL B-16338 / NBRC 102104 / LLR-40K-21) TaxID=446470 RepID=D3Q3J5_STANL|nr:LPXTG cell wall anchor domain-containing protein [Stackebrandtia nassauensis]ADD42036.1 LPXTG-motif cell wall anchor domain protein [Stackebrandtia nassauensis DSM 44728]